MTERNRPMALSAFLVPGGYDGRAWRKPNSRAEELATFGILKEIAQKFEAARFDAIFLADLVGTNHILQSDLSLGSPYEPVSSLGALIGVTKNIGLIGTISTTFSHPYTTARQLAGLDILSGGRIGWNIVTSSGGGEAHGIALPPKEERYRRAVEFLKAVKGLWTAWSDEAVICDRSAGLWVDPDLIKPFEHKGEFFQISGLINIPRSPQGHPVLVQAGQSAGGLNLGADVAEIIYAVQPEHDKAVQYYREQKQRTAERGRNPEHTLILPGIVPYVGRTGAEARDLLQAVVENIDLEEVRTRFQAQYSVKLDDLELNEPVPLERFDHWQTHSNSSRILAYRTYASQAGHNLRDMLINHSSALGHCLVIGSTTQVADHMIHWYETRACDGFSINAPSFPDSVAAICDLLIPALQERGYARTEYAATTLRGNLGLPHPAAWDKR